MTKKKETKENRSKLPIFIGVSTVLALWACLETRKNKTRIEENEVLIKKNKKGIQITFYTRLSGYASDGTWQDGEIDYLVDPEPELSWAEYIEQNRYLVLINKHYATPADAAARTNSKDLLIKWQRGPYDLIGTEQMSGVGRRGMIMTSDYSTNKYLEIKDGTVVETVPIEQEEAGSVVIHEYKKMPCRLYLQISPSEAEQYFLGNYSWTTDYFEGVWLNTTIANFPDLEPSEANIKALQEYFPTGSISEYNPN